MLKVNRREIPGLIPHVALLVNSETDSARKHELMAVMMRLMHAARRCQNYEFSLQEVALIEFALEGYFQVKVKDLLKIR